MRKRSVRVVVMSASAQVPLVEKSAGLRAASAAAMVVSAEEPPASQATRMGPPTARPGAAAGAHCAAFHSSWPRPVVEQHL